MFQLDLGLDRNQYPFIKKKFNSKNKRKFIYIGNDYAYNNFAKNLNFLKKICDKVGKSQFSTVAIDRLRENILAGLIYKIKKH